MNLSEWRQAVRTPTTYRVGNSSFRFQTKFVIFLIGFLLLGVLYLSFPTHGVVQAEEDGWRRSGQSSSLMGRHLVFITENSVAPIPLGGKRGSLLWGSQRVQRSGRYPLSPPVTTEKGLKFRIGIISDLDQDSKSSSGKWISYLRRGNLYLQFNAENVKESKVTMEWDGGEPLVVKSDLNQGGRGMELSELIVFNGKLYSCDDRTGIIYNLLTTDADEVLPVPWVILADGNGTLPKGFKCEWSCIKDGKLYVGGLGKEWTTAAGELVNYNPQYVKTVTSRGEVEHMSWRSNYNKMSQALGIHFPGYVIHESAGWSDILQKWLFLPRRASSEQYHEKTDEKKGTNIMLLANEDFSNVEVRHVGEISPTHGFSSFKWIPGTEDQLMIALKSEEFEGKTATYMMVFDINGNIIMPETKVGDHKYEGIEFL